MSVAALFNAHIEHLCASYARAIEASGVGCDGVLIHSGSQSHWYRDDQSFPFRPWGHFLHWLPVDRPDQLLLIIPGQQPLYFQVVPTDFWYEQGANVEPWWAEAFRIERLENAAQAIPLLQGKGRLAFLGEATAFADAAGIDGSLHSPPSLLSRLDFQRAFKTPYEVEQLRAANQLALRGHEVARQAFEAGASEYEVHLEYLRTCRVLEHETPYPNIVAQDEKAATLHYQNKRRNVRDSQLLLIDAGCRVNNYCSDITRTWLRPNASALMASLISSVERLQQEIIELIVVGRPFLDLHVAAHEGIGEILLNHGICSASLEEILQEGISTLFFPHGLGHLLGIQVHDVGGWQIKEAGDQLRPPPEYPALRNTRPIEPGQVFTIEPGLYFIPTLLDPERSTDRGKRLNWKLIDELLPLGGIRIEDNILITEEGPVNLTRAEAALQSG